MITITAAMGRFGRLVVEALLRRGGPANEIAAGFVATTLKRNGLL